MARPIKAGLDYFPHNCIPSVKIELIEAEFGATGYAIIYKLYEMLFYEGYYCDWNDEVALMFARKNGTGVNVVSEIIDAAMRRGIFHIGLYKKYKILTSAEIQEIYFEAVSRRKQINVKKEYLLVKCAHFSNNVNINKDNADIKSNNVNHNAQSKEKESKLNKIKLNKSKAAFKLPCTNGIYKVTSEQIQHLQQIYTHIDVKRSVMRMIDYLQCNTNSQRPLNAMNNRLSLWLCEDNNKAIENEKNSAVKNKKGNSHDINVFKEIDLINEPYF